MDNSQNKDFLNIFSCYQKQINNQLEEFFNSLLAKKSSDFKQARQVIQTLKKNNLAGGKRLRPVLILTGYYLAGGKRKKEIIRASLSIELIHNYFLIHDDIIDEDELRRGELSLYKYYQKRIDDLHTGISLALVAGDINAALGYQALIESRFPSKEIVRALGILNWTVVRTCQGEMLELSLKQNSKRTEKEIMQVLINKTAFYTIIAPLQIGAVLAKAKQGFLDQLEKLGLSLGIAFQLRDDILGVFGSEEKLGKPVGSDIIENQPNLLIFRALRTVQLKDRQKLKKCLGKSRLTKTEIEGIRKIIWQSGALEYCQQKAEFYILQAKQSIKKIKGPAKQKKFLLDFADYIIKRDY